MKASKKILARTIYKEEKWRNGEKKALYNLRILKLQEIFTTVSIECHRYEGLGVLQNIFVIILLWARKDVVKTSVTHSPAARVPLLCFYDILTSSVIYYWTDARQHGIYLLNRYMDDVRGNLFSLFFFPTWRAVLKMFVRLFRIKASESLEKSLAGAIYKEEK